MLTAHPQFARAAVNYLFKEMFGIGIVEPVDGFDLLRLDPNALPPGQTVQPSHPALLAQLASSVRLERLRPPRDAAHDGELRGLSALGALHARALERDVDALLRAPRHAPDDVRAAPRRDLHGERRRADERRQRHADGDAPPPTPAARAMALPDTTEGAGRYATFLNTFMRGNRDTNPRSYDTSTLQALALMNDANTILPRVLQSTRRPSSPGR